MHQIYFKYNVSHTFSNYKLQRPKKTIFLIKQDFLDFSFYISKVMSFSLATKNKNV